MISGAPPPNRPAPPRIVRRSVGVQLKPKRGSTRSLPSRLVVFEKPFRVSKAGFATTLSLLSYSSKRRPNFSVRSPFGVHSSWR